MAPVKIAGQLHFVDRDKFCLQIKRHGLNGGDPEARVLRDDFFLAGDQRDRVRAGPFGDASVNLTRQKAQRQTDQTGLLRQHALDGQVSLSGVGGTKNCRHGAGPG